MGLFNLVQRCGPKALFPLLLFRFWNIPASEGAGDSLCASRPQVEMFHFNLPALLPGGLLPLPSPPVSTASVTFQTRFLSPFLVAVLPAIRQAVSLRCLPILLFLPLLGTIPSTLTTFKPMICIFSPWAYLYSFIVAIYCSFVLSSFVKCYVWGNCLSRPSSCFIFLCSKNMIGS